VCLPAADAAAGGALLARYAVGRADDGALSSGELRLRTALGDIDVEVLGSTFVEATATALPARSPLLDQTSEPQSCWDVRPLSETEDRTVTLGTPTESSRYRTAGPTRLCTIAAPPDDDDAPLAVRLCYRVRRRGTDAAGPTAITIRDAFGTASGTLGTVEEICLPSEVVAETP
jgi:hypothetical protein